MNTYFSTISLGLTRNDQWNDTTARFKLKTVLNSPK